MKQKVFNLTFISFLFITSCSEQTPQEKEAFDQVLEIIEELPETAQEMEEFVEEENSDKLNGSIKIHTDEKEITVSNWLSRRSSTTFMDFNFSLQACSDGDCTKKLLVNVSGPEIHNQNLPLALTGSPLDEYNAKITFVDADKTEYVSQEGVFELTALSESHITLAFNGNAFEGVGVDGNSIPVTIEVDFEYNFISTDVRSEK